MGETVEPGVRLVRAGNASAMTHSGTNSWILGQGTVAVIDPGPDDPGHLAALLAALAPGERVVAILVTHAHRDHTALVPALKAATGAEVLAHGDALSGRSARMAALAAEGGIAGGEGLDLAFAPDRRLSDGETVAVGAEAVTALWTPGHAAGHMAFLWRDRVFSGDLAMGWASTLISPPDGDVAAFRASLERLIALAPARLYPGHGEPVAPAVPRLDWLLRHRADRSAAILAALTPEPQDLAALTARVYADTPAALLPAARRNLFAHLIDLVDRNLCHADPTLTPSARFRRP